MDSSFKERFRARQPVLGMVIYSCSPIVAEDVAYAGVDFLFIDMEHTPIGWETLEHMIRAAQVARAGTTVRVTENNPSLIRKAIEAGADYVVVPHIASRRDAEVAVKSAMFPPSGIRGATSYPRSASYSVDWSTYLDETNRSSCVVAMIEEQDALDNIEEIASVVGLAGFSFGPLDYSVSTGVVNSSERAGKTREAMRLVGEVGLKHNLVLTAALPPSKEEFNDLLKQGYTAYLLGYDLAVLRKFATDGVARFRELSGGARKALT